MVRVRKIPNLRILRAFLGAVGNGNSTAEYGKFSV